MTKSPNYNEDGTPRYGSTDDECCVPMAAKPKVGVALKVKIKESRFGFSQKSKI